MLSDHLPTKDMFKLLNEPLAELVNLIAVQTESALKLIPGPEMWTAAQIADHITKSTFSIAKALEMKSEVTNRDPAQRVPELKKMFLDFTVKYKSPEFILPTQPTYEKALLITKLNTAFEQLQQRSNRVNLTEMISHPAFGDVTKLELLYFVLFHTQRHLQQIKNTLTIVNQKALSLKLMYGNYNIKIRNY